MPSLDTPWTERKAREVARQRATDHKTPMVVFCHRSGGHGVIPESYTWGLRDGYTWVATIKPRRKRK